MATYRDLSFLGLPDYRVGDDGSVWTRGRWQKDVWKIMKEHRGTRLSVRLYNKTTKLYEGYSLPRLILLTFVGPCPSGMECCHNDGNPRNNALANLRWDTHKNNIKDKEKHGTWQRGERIGTAKLTDAQVSKIWDMWEAGKLQSEIAEEFRIAVGRIETIVSGKGWKHLSRHRQRNEDGTIVRRTHVMRGRENPAAKLTKEIVLEIRRLAAEGVSFNSLGRKFGVSGVSISNVVNRKSWFHI